MITLFVANAPAPLTTWQRRDRFATMRSAQRTAADLRGEAEFMARLPRTYDRDDVNAANQEAAQWEDLALWLGRSVRGAYTPSIPVRKALPMAGTPETIERTAVNGHRMVYRVTGTDPDTGDLLTSQWDAEHSDRCRCHTAEDAEPLPNF